MAVFIVLWPYLLTTKLRPVIRYNIGHSTVRDIKKTKLRIDESCFHMFLFCFLAVLPEVELSILIKISKKRQYNKTILAKKYILQHKTGLVDSWFRFL